MAMTSLSPSVASSGFQNHGREMGGDAASSAQGSISGQHAGLSGSLDDPTSSLRAAALMTLKSKRRKPTSNVNQDASLSGRPAPVAPDIQLDYGDDASLSTTSNARPVATSAPNELAPSSDTARLTDAMEVEEGQIREEGEISDSESPPPPKPLSVSSPTPLSAPPPREAMKSRFLEATGPTIPPRVRARVPSRTADVEATTATSTRTDQASMLPNGFAGSWVSSPTPLSGSPTEDKARDPSVDYVRPGLPLNDQQYEAAKDIVLDLLGWGVPPEFLVSCGLSREIVFYVFSDLNLRLPTNLDITGLVLDGSYPGQSHTAALLPTSQVSHSRRPSTSHPSLPAKPGISNSVSPSTPTAGATGVTKNNLSPAPVQAPSSPSTSLHDMEQLRRQELLARKAVQASRKSKLPSIEIDVQAGSGQHLTVSATSADVDMASSIADETVDDFLKSIGPASEEGRPYPLDVRSGEGRSAQVRSESHDDMDIDIPLSEIYRPKVSANGALSSQSRGMSFSPVTPSDTTSPSAPQPPPVASTSPSTPSVEDDGLNSDTLNGLVPRPSMLPPTQRRGLKRPVAADFVDLEPEPSRYRHPYSMAGYVRGNTSMSKKTGSFASVSGMRRCVIDLSDSEDDNQTESNDASAGKRRSYSPISSSNMRASSRTATPPNNSLPPDLLEKEREIQRMRELIAEKEQRRLRKLAESSRPPSALSSPGTPRPATSQQIAKDFPPSNPLKEEDDGLSSNALSQGRGSPDSSTNGREETKEEDSIMRDLMTTGTEPQISSSSAMTSAQTSGAVTPIDGAPKPLEHVTTGDQVLTAEERYEQVARTDEAASRQESITGMEEAWTGGQTLTSVHQQPWSEHQKGADFASNFTEYVPILERYPLLRTSSRSSLLRPSSHASCSKSIASSSPSLELHLVSRSSPFPPLPDLKPLKLSAAMKALLSLPDWTEKRVCQFEVPGGGECRDATCEDVHLSRVEGVGVEPSDEETAQFLHDSLPEAIRTRLQVPEIKSVLENIRWRGSNEKATIPFEERVAEAWAFLGSAGQ